MSPEDQAFLAKYGRLPPTKQILSSRLKVCVCMEYTHTHSNNSKRMETASISTLVTTRSPKWASLPRLGQRTRLRSGFRTLFLPAC